MEPFVDCCSPDEPCYGCVMLWHHQQDREAGRATEDPVEVAKQAARQRLVAEGKVSERDKVPF